MAYRQPFAVGSVLNRSFSIWFRNIIPFTLMVAVMESPMLVDFYMVASGAIEMYGDLFAITFLLGTFLLGLVATGALTFGVFQQLKGSPAGIGDSIAVGFSRLLPVIGVGLVLAIILGAVFLAISMVVGVAVGAVGFAGFITLPLFAFFFSVMCKYYVAVPAAVVEKPGVLGALRRSAELTQGGRVTVFLIWLALIGLRMLAELVIRNVDTTGWIDVGFTVFWVALQATTSAVIYHDLRVSKEGVDIGELTRVFA
jgi:hypothetical protein